MKLFGSIAVVLASGILAMALFQAQYNTKFSPEDLHRVSAVDTYEGVAGSVLSFALGASAGAGFNVFMIFLIKRKKKVSKSNQN
jgi:hypothetical protein